MTPKEVLLLITMFNSIALGAAAATHHHVAMVISAIAVMAGVIAYGGIEERPC